jgi:GNAT superfamily N-acetyltransferase
MITRSKPGDIRLDDTLPAAAPSAPCLPPQPRKLLRSRQPLAMQQGPLVVRHMHTGDDLLGCFPVIAQLRDDLGDEVHWLRRVIAMKADGYRILAACAERQVVALAGYRVSESLRHGRFLQVDDLVTRRERRGEGIGGALIDELEAIGRDECCGRLVFAAPAGHAAIYRFLEREGLRRDTVGYAKPLLSDEAEVGAR